MCREASQVPHVPHVRQHTPYEWPVGTILVDLPNTPSESVNTRRLSTTTTASNSSAASFGSSCSSRSSGRVPSEDYNPRTKPGGRISEYSDPQMPSTEKPICLDWLEGLCTRRRKKCKFAHPPLHLIPKGPRGSRNVCPVYALSGSCKYGADCVRGAHPPGLAPLKPVPCARPSVKDTPPVTPTHSPTHSPMAHSQAPVGFPSEAQSQRVISHNVALLGPSQQQVLAAHLLGQQSLCVAAKPSAPHPKGEYYH
eukprot:TRINITY_DN94728_c0_g1_i1.p1 TRINITY_DN94728_c0_g1~~TRINITY_DN94728_c0_g1_i1.p1  ORF type:complete len:253 (-),score=7.36 TRINITY_DN94728_c0_g1_i1:241-999(-)